MFWIERGENMQRVLEYLNTESLPNLQKKFVTTTLYEVVEAVAEEVQPEEKQIIPDIVINLLKTCRSNCLVW